MSVNFNYFLIFHILRKKKKHRYGNEYTLIMRYDSKYRYFAQKALIVKQYSSRVTR